MTLQPNTSERLETALASRTVKGPVVATVAPAGISPGGGGIGRWTTITGVVGQTFALDHLSEFDLEQREEPAGVERDIWRTARFSRIR
jgi:hypothetical protein